MARPLSPDRRAFLDWLNRALLAAAGLLGVTGLAEIVASRGPVEQGKRVPLGLAAQFPLGTMQWLASRELFVVHGREGFLALASRCPHLGCTVKQNAQGFSCPCHGARFDTSGRPISGPARRALSRHDIEVDAQGRLWLVKS